MSKTFIEILGLSGGFICTSSIIPQIIKCYRTKSTRDLSWAMFAISYIGLLTNVSYGIAIYHPAIYLTAIYSLCTNSTLVYLKWKFENIADTEQEQEQEQEQRIRDPI